MAPTKMKLRVRKKQGGASKSSQQHRLRPEASPDSKCPICLDRFVNVASVERCLHRFCFRCIREWAKNKAECPLCKQPFRSIFHSVRAEDDFKEYVVFESAAQNAAPSASANVNVTGGAVAPERTDDPESAAPRTRRSRAARRGLAGQDSSGSSMDEGALQRLLPWLRRNRVADPFLLERTGHILHELVSFARSIEAMQCPPAPSYEEDSGSQSSVINISEDDDSEDANVTRDGTQERVPSVSMATGSEISLSQSWDNETPGPSYSSLSQLQTDVPEPEGNPLGGTGGVSAECQEEEEEEDEEECTIVGYVKPMAERTPELVQLSSDSTEEEEEEKEEMQLAVAKVEPPFPSQSHAPVQAQAPPSPKSFPSTSRVETCGLGNPASSDSSAQSRDVRKPDRPRPQSEPRRRISSSSSPSSSPWDVPEPKKCREERRRRRKTRKRGQEKKRSRSPHRRKDRALRLRSSSSSSDADWRLEKPGGKRKYKTRHLERARRQKSRERERERSPSVEIIYERRASDRSGRKKRSRKRAREQISATIITISSSSSSSDETRRKAARSRRPLTDNDDDTDSKNRPEIKQAKNCGDSFTEFIDFLTDYADRNSRCTTRTLDGQGPAVDPNDIVTVHSPSDRLPEVRDASPERDETRKQAVFKDKDEPDSTECIRGKSSDPKNHSHSESSKRRSPADSPKEDRPDVPEGEFLTQDGTDRTKDLTAPDQLLGTLNLEHVMELNTKTSQISAPSLLMDPQGQRGEPGLDGAPTDQKEAGSEPHGDQSEAGTSNESQDDLEMSYDV